MPALRQAPYPSLPQLPARPGEQAGLEGDAVTVARSLATREQDSDVARRPADCRPRASCWRSLLPARSVCPSMESRRDRAPQLGRGAALGAASWSRWARWPDWLRLEQGWVLRSCCCETGRLGPVRSSPAGCRTGRSRSETRAPRPMPARPGRLRDDGQSRCRGGPPGRVQQLE
jgi:hypothetical protein